MSKPIKKKKKSTAKSTAKRLQLQIDDEFGFDVSVFEASELRRLESKLGEFLATGVEPEDLKAAGDY